MYEQDYILRLIKEVIRTLVKLLFNMDTDSPNEELLEDNEDRITLESLKNMIDDGHINEAENSLDDIQNNKIELLFYTYLNEKSDEFLIEHNYTRQEIIDGLKRLASVYGMGDVI